MSLKSPRDADAPLWARYKARDVDGGWHWFECHPKFYKRIGKWTARGQCEKIENWQSAATGANASKADGGAEISATHERSVTAQIEAVQ